jgi:hypothetical protein
MTRILTIIALLFATPAWAEVQQRKTSLVERCIIYDISVGYEAHYGSLRNCKPNTVAAIYGDKSGILMSEICRFDREIVSHRNKNKHGEQVFFCITRGPNQ